MTATMIKIERNEKMEAAIIRCKKAHPKVRRIDADTVLVTSANGTYTVKFVTPREGLRLAECDCKSRTLCYHIVAGLCAPPMAVPAVSRPVAAVSKNAGILIKRERGGMRVDGWMV
jgi:hypothetical protein